MNAFNDDVPLVPLAAVTIGSRRFQTAKLPPFLEFREDLGIIGARTIAGHGQRIHARKPPEHYATGPRCEVMPNGDMLCMFPAGRAPYVLPGGNRMVAYRSRDRGFTWDGPRYAWDSPGPDHEFIPLCPDGSNAVYAFGTQARPDLRAAGIENVENFSLGWRVSTNSGHSWSSPHLILPVNDRTYRGVASMRMCETPSGTWLLGTHTQIWNRFEENGYVGPDGRPRPSSASTRLYVLRSEDRGKQWHLLPGGRPEGWFLPGTDRLEEGRVIALGGPRVLLVARSQTGQVWEMRSNDDGMTWSSPVPTAIPHPDAPPMIFHLNDRRTLIALHHNRAVEGHFTFEARSELWCSFSSDEGKSWSKPGFLLANAVESLPLALSTMGEQVGVQYSDLTVHGGRIHLFLDHQKRQILHFSFAETDLHRLPTEGDLRRF